MIEDIPAPSTFLNADNISTLGQVVNMAVSGEGKVVGWSKLTFFYGDAFIVPNREVSNDLQTYTLNKSHNYQIGTKRLVGRL
ncbi:hypothetical protein DBV15_08237 [Temnothorax longispinosus]|uniref:Uncharacterized protein n=1 Tax=Temnothorax longispinosus TaxID=300112 RepID=A0A4V3SAA2_9HYME|nr:hypothetical protein DBV15_08237 [Temnothorax longispinosus]